ncbi:MAG: succinate dehydrogenase cytochrome b subunit [Saprospiraceae bacterium]|uniref:Succinate dehydrogenase cytochrome b subunit n=1 Tax=Candidatus Opimibacter skivensis TaxID=2982028 RepID=A0A9D7XSJ3_9BACT|nr:succinate dehydrogenase cytochrome b subunit [Candidatus Opimibacter skivensis]
MKWITKLLTSSLGQKLIMSLTGIFLILFLIVHLVGNLQLLAHDNGESFNIYAAFMSHNPFIRVISIGLYAFILLHSIQGIALWLTNRKAKGGHSSKGKVAGADWSSRNMALLGVLIFAFLCIHMGDFWVKMRFTDSLPLVNYPGHEGAVEDIFSRVHVAFQNIWIVIIYVVGVIALAFHLVHGFQSAFQTLGLNHKKYTPLIKGIGWLYAILFPLGFAILPLYHYFNL